MSALIHTQDRLLQVIVAPQVTEKQLMLLINFSKLHLKYARTRLSQKSKQR